MRSIILVLVASSLILGTAGMGCSAETEAETVDDEANLTAQDRAALMDALRAKVQPDLGAQDIVFNVSQGSLRIASGYAFLMGKVELRSGGEPETRGTAYEQDANEGLFDGFHIEALMKKEGARWVVLEHGIGSTDVWWDGIEERYSGAPRSIFPWLDSGAGEVAPSERMAIMNGLRATVKPELGNQDIVFNVSAGVFRVRSDYCWLQGKIQLRDGREPTTEGTIYEEAARDGLFDGFRIEALLKKQGDRWRVVEHGIGSTDVWYVGIAERHPEAAPILPQLGGGTGDNN